MRAFFAILLLSSFPGVICAATPPSTPPNVLLITVDTLRADHLSCYGYQWQTSPSIDKLAREGTRFERAYTPIPLTGPAHLSLFTSRYPHEHGARRNGVAMSNDGKLATLPQILRASGYHNAAFISAWPLTARLTNIDAWFDHYDENLTRKYQLFNSSRWAEDVTPPAIDWLKQNGRGEKPFFLWVHYFDPHSPYDFREHFADMKPNPAARSAPTRDVDMEETVRNYDTEIAYMDWYIGKLLASLDELQISDSTLVVLTADHGESLGEHDYVGHGRHLYENIIRVPLIVRLPGKVMAGQTVATPVSLLDVTPTILDLTVRKTLDEKKAPLNFAGRTLALALAKGQRPAPRRIFYVTFPGKKGFAPNWLSWVWVRDRELPSRFGYLDGNSKFVWVPDEQTLSAYDVSRDPFELQPRKIGAGSSPYKAETDRLKNWFVRTESRAGEERRSAQDIEVLKSLGYIQ